MVQMNECVSCPMGTTSKTGQSADGFDTGCDVLVCPKGEKVTGNDCVKCAFGHTDSPDDETDECADVIQITPLQTFITLITLITC